VIPTDPGRLGETPALLVIDPQYDFVDPSGSVYCPASSVGSTDEVVDNIRTLVGAARDADLPVLWTKESHRPDRADYGAELLSIERDHAIEGTEGERFVQSLSVAEGELPAAEYLVTKRRYNCFHNTDLEHLLSTFDVDTLLIAGVTTNVCVHYTAQGAYERDYVFRVVEECTAGTSQDLHDAALEMLAYLQPGGVQSLDAVTDPLGEYEGNDIVERVKKTGSVLPQ
jgi:nicotinamidase-related amidase